MAFKLIDNFKLRSYREEVPSLQPVQSGLGAIRQTICRSLASGPYNSHRQPYLRSIAQHTTFDVPNSHITTRRPKFWHET